MLTQVLHYKLYSPVYIILHDTDTDESKASTLLTFLQGATFSYVYLLLGLLVSRLDNQKEMQAKMVAGNIPQ